VSGWKRSAKRLLRAFGLHVRRAPAQYNCHHNPFTDQRAILGPDGARVILDGGANVGQSVARYRWLFPRAVIHSFEPVPEAFEALRQAAAGDTQVHLWPLALSDADGVAAFHSNRMSDTSSLLPTRPDRSDDAFVGTRAVIEVPTKTLDRFCEEQQIRSVSILKLDVQGGEARVLAGAKNLLARQRADLILTEVWFDAPYVGAPHFTEIDVSLRRYGYRLYGLYFGPHQSENIAVFTADAIYVSEAILAGLDRQCRGIDPAFASEFTDLFGE
jgi:FkbM family methyltransferase